jgi:hypothetical protein
MDPILIRSLIATLPACLLFSGAIISFSRGRTTPAFLQVTGAGSLLVVVLVHIFEALQLFSQMHWGLEHSAGHYLDLSSAILGFTLFPIGYLLQALNRASSQ